MQPSTDSDLAPTGAQASGAARDALAKGAKIAVIGAGFMGSVIATVYARYGYRVALHDTQPGMLGGFRERALPIARKLAGPDGSADRILDRVTLTAGLGEAVEGAPLVHEVVQEELPTKQRLFGELDALCDPSVVLATNTSSFLLSEIVAGVRHRERVVGIHYVTPAHIVPVVEIITAEFTPGELVDWSRRFLATIEHVGVVCRERPGFLVNRIQFAMLSEVYRIVDEGLATPEDVDAAVRLSLGPRLALWGPLLTEDLVVSKKTALSVTEYLREQTGDENYAGRKALKDLVAHGHLGAISGQGWYRFGRPHAEVVAQRDRQLSDLLEWLGAIDAVKKIGLADGATPPGVRG